jgi:hypothetical protein
VVALLAVGVTTCSLATARAAIRATKAEVPSSESGAPPVRADPAFADRVACLGPVLAVSIASGGTAGDTSWLAFVRASTDWRVVKAEQGYKLGLFPRGDRLEVVQPVYAGAIRTAVRRVDTTVCSTGSTAGSSSSRAAGTRGSSGAPELQTSRGSASQGSGGGDHGG